MSSLALVPASTFVSTLSERLTYAEQFFASGLFSDMRSAAQALVKIQAGAELGFGIYASMNGISIIQGKACIGGGMYAALIEASPGHDLEILETTHLRARGRFHALSVRTGQWEVKGEFTFTMEDAGRMGLAGKDNWRKSPQQMLYWRMLSNGARMFFPALCAGLYIPEELNSYDPSDDQGQIVNVESRPVQATQTLYGNFVNAADADLLAKAELKARRLAALKAWRDHPHPHKEGILPLILKRPLDHAYIAANGKEVSAVAATFRDMTGGELDHVELFLTTGEIPAPIEGDEDDDGRGDGYPELPDPFLDEEGLTEIQTESTPLEGDKSSNNAPSETEASGTIPGLVNANEQTLNAINGQTTKIRKVR
jgi:hypothetical protein